MNRQQPALASTQNLATRWLLLFVLVAWGSTLVTIRSALAETESPLMVEQRGIESGDDLSPRARKVLFRARNRQNDGNYTEARDLLAEWLDDDPNRDHVLLRFNLAVSYLALDQSAAALEQLRRAVELEPRYGRAWLRLGEAAYEQAHYAEAGEAFARGHEFTPDAPVEILYYSAVAMVMAEQPAPALATLEQVLATAGAEVPRDWVQALVAAAVAAGQADRARPHIDALLLREPAEPAAWLLAYRFAAGEQDYKLAAVCLTVAGYLRPAAAEELEQLGDLYAVIGVPVQAATYYAQALELALTGEGTGNLTAQYERLAGTWLAAHRHPEARAVLDAALATAATSRLWSLRGDLDYHAEDFAAALEAFSSSCRLDPEYGRGWLMMGYCALELGRNEEARRHLQKAAGYPDQAAGARVLLQRLQDS